jgi:hypothetical protein
MLVQKIIGVAFVLSLSGCAVAFHAANGTLGDVIGKPAASTHVQVTSFADGTGYQPIRSIEVPADVCDKDALVDGYKESYVLSWNEFVNAKVRQFSPNKVKAKGKARPAEMSSVQNLALYKSYLIGTSQGTEPKQQSKRPPSSDTCKSAAFSKGWMMAQTDAEGQRQEALAKEVK